MPTTPDILKSIERGIAQLERELASLVAARAAITKTAITKTVTTKSPITKTKAKSSPAATPTAPAKPRRGRRAAPKPATRAAGAVRADGLEQLLEASDGITTAALAERANAAPDRVLALLRELEQKGRIRRSGQRRSTRWHVLTDEDRVAARAAEIEARIKAPRRRRAAAAAAR